MLLLKNVTLVAANPDLNGQAFDVYINEKGIIETIGKDISAPKNTTVFEREGTHVSIGWVDVGTQTGDPGFEHREDLNSVTKAAMAGGFTTICPFPNTNPTIQSKSEVLYIKNKTQDYLVDFQPIGALSEEIKGKNIAEMLDMHHAGAIAFSDGKKTAQEGGLILRGMQYAKIFEGLVMNFPYDKSVSPNGQMHEGLTSTSLGLSGIPSMAEELMVQRDLQLLEYANSRLHLHNISTEASVEMVRKAKRKGLQVTASVAALNLCFSDEILRGFDSNFKVLPPLREQNDIDALVKGLKDGTIDFISTNHTPIDIEGKDLEFPYADFGAITLESAFGLINNALHNKLKINELVHFFTINARRLLGLEIPQIKERTMANLTIFNPTEEWTFTENDIHSKSKNAPALGKILRGRVYGVVNNGKVKMIDRDDLRRSQEFHESTIGTM
jgi:dihydroorotase